MADPKKIITRLMNQEPQAQRELIKNYHSRIFLYFKLRIKGEDDYEDLVQEVFASFFKSIKKNKIEEDKFIGPFIFGIAKRTVFNYFYKKKKNENIQSKISREFEISYEFKEDRRLENEKLTALINEVIERLPNIDKLILKEFYLRENNVGQVAELIGKSKHYVSVRKLRALNRIKTEISKKKHLYNI